MIQKSTLVGIVRFLLYVVLIIGALFALFGLFGKKAYRLERRITIAAPVDLVYDQVRYFRNFKVWSPWAGMDAEVRIEGKDGLPGATFLWSGKGETGKGSMVLKALATNRLDFEVATEKPYRSISPTWFVFEADSSGQTIVKWVFYMHIAYPWNGLAMFTDINRYVGQDFEAGLENLKRHCETMVPRLYAGYEVRAEECREHAYAGFRQQVPLAQVEIFIKEHLRKLDLLIRKHQLTPLGPKTALFWNIDSTAHQADVAVGVPIVANREVPFLVQRLFFLEGGPCFWVEQQGQLELNAAQKALMLYLEEKGKARILPLMVEYLSSSAVGQDSVRLRIGVRASPALLSPPDSTEMEVDTIPEANQ
ncbi:MAG: SRPBCC family protein [Saprospiraceae bacterium]|nr:SRPBCC family protein [Saprospiraceae bacterium]MDW8484381.1 SRPBCC family protein [Saprospiraceae bacterium]